MELYWLLAWLYFAVTMSFVGYGVIAWYKYILLLRELREFGRRLVRTFHDQPRVIRTLPMADYRHKMGK